MRQKFFITAVFIFALTLILGVPQAQACKSCSYQQKSLKEKFFHKAHHFLKSKEQLGLSDEQVSKIKSVKIDMKKDLIMKDAEIEVIAIDIKSQLWKEEIDVNAVHALIDKKYDIKKAKTKSLVQAIADLKSVLTDKQKKTLKDSWKESKGSKKQ